MSAAPKREGNLSGARRVIIRLPLTHRPVFPDLCVDCGRPHPHHCQAPLANLWGHSWDDQTAAAMPPGMEAFGWVRELEVPYCNRCHPTRKTLNYPIGRLSCLAILVCGFIGVVLAESFGLGHDGFMAIAFGLLILAAGVVGWLIYSRSAFTVSLIRDESLEFQFRNERVAGEFARLNAAADRFDAEAGA